MPTPVELVEAYGRQYDRIRKTAADRARRWFERFGGPTDSDLERWLQFVIPLVEGSQSQTGALVDAFFAQFATELGEPRGVVGLDVEDITGPAVRNGATAETVYSRAVVDLRSRLGENLGIDRARQIAAGRARSSVETDIALSHRAAHLRVIDSSDSVSGYRRVLTGRSCMICATASTQRYSRQDLLPIHPHCDCRIAPIMGSEDVGRVVNGDLLSELKRGGGPQYWKDRGFVEVDSDGNFLIQRKNGDISKLETAVRDHGELGPTLTDSAHAFTSAGDLAA